MRRQAGVLCAEHQTSKEDSMLPGSCSFLTIVGGSSFSPRHLLSESFPG